MYGRNCGHKKLRPKKREQPENNTVNGLVDFRADIDGTCQEEYTTTDADLLGPLLHIKVDKSIPGRNCKQHRCYGA